MLLTDAILGFALGFVGSLPVAGPVAVIVLKRALESRVAEARAVGLGAGVAEGMYAGAAAFGVGLLSGLGPWFGRVSNAVGALVLAIVALKLLRSAPRDATKDAEPTSTRHATNVALGASLIAFNPTLIATWTLIVAQVASFGVVITPLGALFFGVGAALGTSSSFAIMATLVHRIGARFGTLWAARIQRGFGVFVMCLVVVFAFRAITGR